MFASRYYCAVYFAPRYFPKIGGVIVASAARLLALLGVGS